MRQFIVSFYFSIEKDNEAHTLFFHKAIYKFKQTYFIMI